MSMLESTGKIIRALEGQPKGDALRVLGFATECVEKGPDIVAKGTGRGSKKADGAAATAATTAEAASPAN